ncbi:AlpA family phage regulatory protein [Motilimonas sp. E26]|uniref:helix-turn-helix transcriptional regulator n=1 Tax=Motilimonas sp. E26 TaxID=2865674 RepID=UPI001E5F2CCC|nr:AlpA family phage regulatory protein [Motilimonas sp. E26]MCE0557407.1 AlpA family phage regulatory protein [Motilimonas sp. E26]
MRDFDPILSLNDASEIIGRSKRSLWRWYAKDKTMPEPLKVNGRAVGWRKSTFEQWLVKLEGAAK